MKVIDIVAGVLVVVGALPAGCSRRATMRDAAIARFVFQGVHMKSMLSFTSLARQAGRVAPGRATTLGPPQTSAQRALEHEVHRVPSERIQELIG